MKLLNIESSGFLGLPDGVYSTNDDIVAVDGGPISGKTSLLRAIVYAKECLESYGFPPQPRPVTRPGVTTGYVKTEWELTAQEMSSGQVSERVIHARAPLGTSEDSSVSPALARVLESESEASGKLVVFPAD